MRWGVFAADRKGVLISIIVSALIFFSGWYVSDFLKDKTSKKVFEIHKVLQK
jgi:hypothetical protein